MSGWYRLLVVLAVLWAAVIALAIAVDIHPPRRRDVEARTAWRVADTIAAHTPGNRSAFQVRGGFGRTSDSAFLARTRVALDLTSQSSDTTRRYRPGNPSVEDDDPFAHLDKDDPYADLIPKGPAGDNPFADLIPKGQDDDDPHTDIRGGRDAAGEYDELFADLIPKGRDVAGAYDHLIPGGGYAAQRAAVLAVLSDHEREVAQVGRARFRFARGALLVWAIPLATLWAFGWAIGWVYRGFRRRL